MRMPAGAFLLHFRDSLALLSMVPVLVCASVAGQDLAPRSYVITPIHSNAAVLTYSYFNGNIDLQGATPIEDAKASAHSPIFAVYHSMSLLGRSANLTAGLPYGLADFSGTAFKTEANVHRSGLIDSVYRLSVNLAGGPAMPPLEFRKWQQKNLFGTSIRVVAPTGQYDSKKLINFGTNRWGFKPEVGYSRRNGHWIFDTYFGIWLYTTNPKFFSPNKYHPDIQTRHQAPVPALEGHVSYDVKPRFWLSFDANFWFGGATSINGVKTPNSELRNSRLGATSSFPLNKHQSVKFSYSNGAYIRYGGNFQNVSVAWQYAWLGRPK